MTIPGKTRSFLAAARVANLPGVASHATTGCLLAWWLLPSVAGGPATTPWPWGTIALAAAAGVLLCIAGNLLNDWHDHAWDARHRPERALPAGHFHPATFFVLGSTSLIAGVAMMFFANASSGLVALAIAACVAVYTRMHKRALWTVVPLAMCRALLPWMGALAVHGGAPAFHDPGWWIIAAFGTALFAWTCGLSLDARGESTGGGGPALAPWLLLAAAPLIPLPWLTPRFPLPWLGLLPAILWLGIVRGPYRHTAKQRVSALLAGLPLLDLAVLIPACHLAAAGHTWMSWIPLLAFALGRQLQRTAAAT